MDNESLKKLVYSKNVVEFITVASEFCGIIENVRKFSLEDNLKKMQLILPLLYLKAALLPNPAKLMEEELEKFVSEMDYNLQLQKWLEVLGEHDSFYEVFDPDIQFGEEITTASISESLIDIYQDLKDFLTSYSIGDELIMNDSLYDCVFHFEQFWGQRLVNVLRAIHMLITGDIDFSEDSGITHKPGTQTVRPEWFDKFFNAGSGEE